MRKSRVHSLHYTDVARFGNGWMISSQPTNILNYFLVYQPIRTHWASLKDSLTLSRISCRYRELSWAINYLLTLKFVYTNSWHIIHHSFSFSIRVCVVYIEHIFHNDYVNALLMMTVIIITSYFRFQKKKSLFILLAALAGSLLLLTLSSSNVEWCFNNSHYVRRTFYDEKRKIENYEKLKNVAKVLHFFFD